MIEKKKELVYLRERKRSNGVTSLYLDICRNGKRCNEYLKLYLIPEHSREDKIKNKETLRLAESIKAQRIVELQSKQFGVDMTDARDIYFYEYINALIDKKKGTTKISWQNCRTHLIKYEPDLRITFADTTQKWVQGFRDYLDKKAYQWDIDERKRQVKPMQLSQGTKALMFQKLCSVFNHAVRAGVIQHNPTVHVKRFKAPESHREFLTIEELRKLTNTPPPNKEIARAFLFSCLTGLRWSDIVDLQWKDIQHIGTVTRIVFTQKKTQNLEYLDLNHQAVDLLGSKGKPNDKIFKDLMVIQQARVNVTAWVRAAGIDKHITFHCARHTFAVMMLDLGVDLYTVSKLLGHKSIETTQVYAKILDKNKQAAVEKIPNIFAK